MSKKLKIIHTADWHLGQRLCERDRQKEHLHFLDWLLTILKKETIDALIIAGDIFDIGNPPNYSLRQYYDFLRQAIPLCPNIIITGGNHDSVATLNAPQNLLEHFHIHVIGGATPNIEEEIIELKNRAGQIIGAVGAVPFLRDRDLKRSVAGEAYSERVERLKDGIKLHYQQIYELLQPYKTQHNVPIIVTGHLYAAGSELSDSEKDIHIGNQGQITADIFHPDLDYVALGHIHKPQIINKQQYIRYSGSPIPLSFSERKDVKQILIVTFEEGQLQDIHKELVPVYRKLLHIKGNLEQVKAKLNAIDHPEDQPTHWVEVTIQIEQYIPNLDEQIRAETEGKNIELLKIRTEYLNLAQKLHQQVAANINLDDLNPKDVFLKKLNSRQIPEPQHQELVETFDLLINLMNEQETP